MFSGQGGQWIGMGQTIDGARRGLPPTPWKRSTAFSANSPAGRCSAKFAKGEGDSRIDDTIIVQPAVMAIQIALFKLYEHYGIRPQASMGHSIGEVAAAFAAGALSLEDAVQVIYQRSQAQNRAYRQGGHVGGRSFRRGGAESGERATRARCRLPPSTGRKCLRCRATASRSQQIAQVLEARGIFNRPVRVQVAYHSHIWTRFAA